MRIWNADGSEVEACGNATRCIAWLMMQASGEGHATIDSKGGLLEAWPAGERQVTVDMGAPRLGWQDIPLEEEMDTRGIELQVGPIDRPVLHTPGAVSMGNPHVVFFVPDAEAAPVEQVGPLIEHHLLFPEGVNVGFAEVRANDDIRLRVWERGAGLTRACGTGACAAVVAANRRGLAWAGGAGDAGRRRAEHCLARRRRPRADDRAGRLGVRGHALRHACAGSTDYTQKPQPLERYTATASVAPPWAWGLPGFDTTCAQC